jgi:hypothetical protein
MTDLVLKELRARHAQLNLKAERLRVKQRATLATSPSALVLGREVREVQAQADNYADLIEAAEGM